MVIVQLFGGKLAGGMEVFGGKAGGVVIKASPILFRMPIGEEIPSHQ